MQIVKTDTQKTNICLRLPVDLVEEVNDMLAAVRKIQKINKTDLLIEYIKRGLVQVETDLKEVQQ